MNELSELIKGIKDGEKLVLEHGKEYCVFENDCFVEEGTDRAPRRFAVRVCGKKNVTIDGGGSALKVYGDIAPIFFENCKNVTVKNLTVDFACGGCVSAAEGKCAYVKAENVEKDDCRGYCGKSAGAFADSCGGVTFENVRFKNFDGTAVYARRSKDVSLIGVECVLSLSGGACDGFFRFEDCTGKITADGCTARGGESRGDFLHVRGKEKCDLLAVNNCADATAGRGVYYACRGKVKIIGNTFRKTGGAAFCAKDFGVYERGALGVKKVVFENNVVDGCGNAYEEKYSVAYFPATFPEEKGENAPAAKKKPAAKIVLKNNHFFNPENEEHRIYLSELKRAVLKNNSFDRPYDIGKENVKKITEKKDVAAEKC